MFIYKYIYVYTYTSLYIYAYTYTPPCIYIYVHAIGYKEKRSYITESHIMCKYMLFAIGHYYKLPCFLLGDVPRSRICLGV